MPSKLEQLRTEQLEQLLTVEAALKQYIIEHVSTVPAARTLRDIQARNVELAQDNLNMQVRCGARLHTCTHRFFSIKSLCTSHSDVLNLEHGASD